MGLDSLPYAPHLTFAAMRAALAGGVLLTVAALVRAPLPRGAKTWGWLCIAGFGATMLGYLGMFHAAEFVAPGFATVIANAQPLIAAVLAYAVLKERLGPRAHVGLAIEFASVVIVAAPDLFSGGGTSTAKGVAYVLLAATGVSIGNVAIKRIAGALDPSSAMGLQLIIGAVPIAFFASLTENPLTITWATQFIASLCRAKPVWNGPRFLVMATGVDADGPVACKFIQLSGAVYGNPFGRDLL